jgi:hypothetical protein
MAGKNQLKPTPIKIGHPGKFKQNAAGHRVLEAPEPYTPEGVNHNLYPVGNSLGYGIQLAQLMGAEEIVALGFTLRSNAGYEHGAYNPVTKRPTRYTDDHVERVIHWCRWFEGKYPGLVKVGSEWDGPLREVFETHGI